MVGTRRVATKCYVIWFAHVNHVGISGINVPYVTGDLWTKAKEGMLATII
jgi:hypothetical protein